MKYESYELITLHILYIQFSAMCIFCFSGGVKFADLTPDEGMFIYIFFLIYYIIHI